MNHSREMRVGLPSNQDHLRKNELRDAFSEAEIATLAERPNEEEIASGKAGFFSEGSREIFWRTLASGEKIVVKRTDVKLHPSYSADTEKLIHQIIARPLKQELGVKVEEVLGTHKDETTESLITKFVDGESMRGKNKILRKILGVCRSEGVVPSDFRIDDLIMTENGDMYLVDLDTWHLAH